MSQPKSENTLNSSITPTHFNDFDIATFHKINYGNPDKQSNNAPPTNETTDYEKHYFLKQDTHKLLEKGNFEHADLPYTPLMDAAVGVHRALMGIEDGEVCTICRRKWPNSTIGQRNKMCTYCTNEKKNTKKTHHIYLLQRK